MSAPWQAGVASVGTFVKIPAPEVVELLAAAGLGFIVIDAEHGAFDVRTLSTMVSVARALRLPVFVRVAGHTPADVQPALDAGVDGLFVPHVDSPRIAQAAVSACRFPPVGNRGGSPFSRAGGWGLHDPGDYVAHGAEVTIVAQIETGEAAVQAGDIGSVPGIDAVFVGPFDLALATGRPVAGPELRELVQATERRCRQAGVPVGGLAGAGEPVTLLLERGLDFVLAGNDASLLAGAARGLTEGVRP